jgi:hypothetical protein
MAAMSEISIRCEHCKEWFPSPIQYKDTDHFGTSFLTANRAPCPHCKKSTGCNKENIRVRGPDGGFVGIDA